MRLQAHSEAFKLSTNNWKLLSDSDKKKWQDLGAVVCPALCSHCLSLPFAVLSLPFGCLAPFLSRPFAHHPAPKETACACEKGGVAHLFGAPPNAMTPR